jgi:hypothetical protein
MLLSKVQAAEDAAGDTTGTCRWTQQRFGLIGTPPARGKRRFRKGRTRKRTTYGADRLVADH